MKKKEIFQWKKWVIQHNNSKLIFLGYLSTSIRSACDECWKRELKLSWRRKKDKEEDYVAISGRWQLGRWRNLYVLCAYLMSMTVQNSPTHTLDCCVCDVMKHFSMFSRSCFCFHLISFELFEAGEREKRSNCFAFACESLSRLTVPFMLCRKSLHFSAASHLLNIEHADGI